MRITESDMDLLKVVADTVKDDVNVALLRDQCKQTTLGLLKIFWRQYWESEGASPKMFAQHFYAWIDLNAEDGGDAIKRDIP